jgi:hypothetical protein
MAGTATFSVKSRMFTGQNPDALKRHAIIMVIAILLQPCQTMLNLIHTTPSAESDICFFSDGVHESFPGLL